VLICASGPQCRRVAKSIAGQLPSHAGLILKLDMCRGYGCFEVCKTTWEGWAWVNCLLLCWAGRVACSIAVWTSRLKGDIRSIRATRSPHTIVLAKVIHRLIRCPVSTIMSALKGEVQTVSWVCLLDDSPKLVITVTLKGTRIDWSLSYRSYCSPHIV
jgi:hypothetical protein